MQSADIGGKIYGVEVKKSTKKNSISPAKKSVVTKYMFSLPNSAFELQQLNGKKDKRGHKLVCLGKW